LKLEDVGRGMLLATRGTLQPAGMIDARLHLLASFDRPLRNRARVRVHHGAAEVMGRVILLDRETLDPGDSAPVQLRLEEPLCTERGDRMVLRFYSPMRTLGGAEVVDPHPSKHKRFRDDVLQDIALKETGGPADLILDALHRAGISGMTNTELERSRIVAPEKIAAVLPELQKQSKVFEIGGRLYETVALELGRQEVCRLGETHQKSNPLVWGIGRAELQERLGWKGARAQFAELLEFLSSKDGDPQINLRSDALRVGSTSRQLSPEDAASLDAMESALQAGHFAPPSAAELQKGLKVQGRFAAYVGLLEEQGRVVRLSDALLYHPAALQEIESRLKTFLADHDTMKMSDFKEMMDISRKYAVPLLEFFDRRGVTTRDGDVRKPGPQLRASK